MGFRRLQKADKWIVGIALLCFAVSLRLIIDDRWLVNMLSEDTEGLTSIGAISTVEEDVRRRYKVAFSWLPLQSDDVIFQGDSIFTGPNSGATIKTFRGEEIYIAPNSLVVISSQQDSLLLKIDYGSIKGKVEEGKKLFISSSEGVTEFSGQKAVVNVNVKKNKPLVVKVLEGEVTVTSKEKENTLIKNQSVEVKSSVSLEALVPQLQVIGPIEKEPLVTQPEAEKVAEKKIQITPSPVIEKFKKVYTLQSGRKTWLTKSLPYFQWTEIEGAKSYDIEISRDTSFKKPVFRGTSSRTGIRWSKPEFGRFFVRVRARTEESLSAFSGTRLIEVKWPAPDSLAERLIEEEVSELSLMDVPPPPLEVKWTSVPHTPFYELHFSDSSDFKKNLVLNTTMTEKKVQPPTPGTYYWRVRALNSSKLPISKFSPTYSITFKRIYQNPEKVKDLITLYPKLGQSVVFVGKGTDRLQFRWSRPFNKVTYRLQASSSSSFSELLIDKTTPHNWLNIKDELAPGNIYWRVRAETPSAETPWTRVSRFELIFQKSGFDLNSPSAFPVPSEPPPLKPMATDRQKGMTVATFIEPAQKNKPVPAPVVPTQLKGPDDLKIKLRRADKVPNTLFEQLEMIEAFPKFSWNVPTSDQIYILEVSPEKDFAVLSFSKKISTPPWEWRNFRPGKYFWRVASENSLGQRSEFSEVRPINLILPAPETKDDVSHYPFIEWYPQLFISSYELEISSTEDFSNSKKFVTPYNTFKKSTLEKGRYFWRVRSRLENRTDTTDYSLVKTFEYNPEAQRLADQAAFNPPKRVPAKVYTPPTPAPAPSRQPAAPLLPPDLDTDNSEFVVRFDKSKISNPWMLSQQSIGAHLATLKDYPLFKWFPKTSQKTYFKFEISTDPQFNQKLFSKTLHVQHFQWRTFQPGVYFWRVASQNSKGETSGFSMVQKFTVIMEPPANLSALAADNAQRAPTSDNMNVYELIWEPLPFARAYEIQLGKDSNFKEVKIMQTGHPRQKVQVSSKDTYYWKVRALDAQGKPLTEFTPVESFGGNL